MAWTAVLSFILSGATTQQRIEVSTDYTKQLATNLLTHISH
jgi:hypothetical protein